MRHPLPLLLALTLGSPIVAQGWKKHVVHEGERCNTAVAADFTADGKIDVVASSGGKTRLFVAPSWKEVILDPGEKHDFIHAAVFDVDGDGVDDPVLARYNPGLILWFERPQNPLRDPWTTHLVDDKVHGIHGLLCGDVDRDGKIDLLATSAQAKGEFPESLAWYRVPDAPRRAARWERHVFAVRDAPGLSHYLGFGDVNGDGRPDAASAAKGGPRAPPGSGDWFAWWEAPRDPRAPWKKHVIADGEPGATNVHPVDVNGDGRTDFIASRGHGRGVVWFEAPTWKRHEIDASLEGPHCLVVSDIDGDGDADAATCAKDSKIAAWFENDGKGSFETHIIDRDQAAYDIRAVDMDSDGDPDLLIAGQSSHNVVWYENRLAATVERCLSTIRRVGPDGRGSVAARRARDVLARRGKEILPTLLDAMDTGNIVAANWLRSAFEEISARDVSPPERAVSADALAAIVRDPARQGRLRRYALTLLVRGDPDLRADLLSTLTTDPEFRGDAVDLALTRGHVARKAGDEEGARVAFSEAYAAARERDRIQSAARALRSVGDRVDMTRDMGFVTRWSLIGPFDAEGTSGFARTFAPERRVDLAATHVGKDKEELRWAAHETGDRFGQTNLIRAIGDVGEAVAYAHTVLESPRARQALVLCGADDNITVWLNGDRVLAREQWLNGTRPDRFRTPVRLRAGRNELLVKICQGPQHKNPTVPNNWTFHLRLVDESLKGISLQSPADVSEERAR